MNNQKTDFKNIENIQTEVKIEINFFFFRIPKHGPFISTKKNPIESLTYNDFRMMEGAGCVSRFAEHNYEGIVNRFTEGSASKGERRWLAVINAARISSQTVVK